MKETNQKTNKRKAAGTSSEQRTQTEQPKRSKQAKLTKQPKQANQTKQSKRSKQTKQSKQAGRSASEKKTDSARRTAASAAGRAGSSSRSDAKKAAEANTATRKNSSSAPASHAHKKPRVRLDTLKIIPIGGLNEIGKNMTAVEYRDEIVIIDCGMSFPEDDMYGIDVVIPDFSYIVKNADKVRGIIVTHGHEDHIGGIPYILRQIRVPVYATRITLGLIDNKLKERGITADLRSVTAGDKIKLGSFSIETIRTTHSVADAICFYIVTPAAALFHTGDFKIDYTPIDGEPINLQKFAEIGQRGVDIMLADSTNALRPGFTKSEKFVGERLDGIFARAKGRIIIATFSSNVHRVQKIIELAAKYGRRFSVSGRSMEKVVTLAQELGYLKIPRGSYVPLESAKDYADSKMVIITTGSQGEPMSALTRMANDEHRNVRIKKGDMVILSSTPVPGNEKSVSGVVNKLYDKGVDVIYNEIADIHVSGHACQEELKLIHSLIRPKFFMPVHGETRHLVEHAKLAESLGKPKENIFILSNGDMLTVDKSSAVKTDGVVSADDVLVDGLGIGDVGNVVLKERKLLSESGLIIIVASIDKRAGEIVAGPDIVSRGFVYVKENEDLINKARSVAERVISDFLRDGNCDWNDMKTSVREELRRFISKTTQKSPIILPVFMKV